MDNKMLVKNNAFITAKYNLTLDENRLFVYILYNIQKNKNGLSCTIKRDDFCNIFKNRTNSSVKGVTKVLDEIKKKSIYFKENLEDGSTNWGSYVFLMGYVYNNKSDSFKIEVPDKVYNLLMQYIDGYTPITLQTWLGLKNTYAQRFYDLLRMWSGTKNIINYKVDDLKMYFQIEDKYPNFKDFKRRVINPAIKELNETGYFEIDIKENKVGRKVDSIDFIVKDLDKRKYFTKDVEVVKEIQKPIKVEQVKSPIDSLICEVAIDLEDIDKPKVEDKKINDLKSCDSELYIPDETVFTKGTLRSFKKDFKSIDFKSEYMERAFDDALSITMERDDIETIKVTSYKFFKGCLDNKIVEYKLEEQEDIKPKEFNIQTLDSNSVKKNEIDDFYIPNKKLFTAKTLSDFIKDFNQYDFKDTKYKNSLQESILIALDKDDEEKIKVKSYNYFKKTLENKIDKLNLNDSKVNNERYKKNKFNNFTETYLQYSNEELDEIIEKSQKQKYKLNSR